MRDTILIPYLQKYNLNRKLAIYFCILIPFMLTCSFLNMNIEPIAATVTELSTCTSVGENGEPLEISETFSSSTERIFVCGYLKTIQPTDIDIHWYYEDELVFQQSGENLEGYFYSFVEPGKAGTFPEGLYRIEVLVGGVVAESTEFRVE